MGPHRSGCLEPTRSGPRGGPYGEPRSRESLWPWLWSPSHLSPATALQGPAPTGLPCRVRCSLGSPPQQEQRPGLSGRRTLPPNRGSGDSGFIGAGTQMIPLRRTLTFSSSSRGCGLSSRPSRAGWRSQTEQSCQAWRGAGSPGGPSHPPTPPSHGGHRPKGLESRSLPADKPGSGRGAGGR